MGRFSLALFGSCTNLGIYSRSSRLSCGLVQAVRWPGGPLECCSIRAGNGNGVGFTGGHHFQLVPHGGSDPPALIVGWYNLRHMVSRRRGGCTAGRLEGKEREEGAGACTILPRLYCKSGFFYFSPFKGNFQNFICSLPSPSNSQGLLQKNWRLQSGI